MARRRRQQSALGRFFSWLFSGPEQPASRRRAPRARPARRRAAEPRTRPATTERRSGGDLAARLSRGDFTPAELEDLFRSGQVRHRKRNPMPLAAMTLAHNRGPKRNPCPGEGAARGQAARFHGGRGDEVLCLHGRPHVVLGELEAVEYKPPRGSRRGGSVWRHESGDQGDGQPRLRGRAQLVADAETGRVEIAGGPARFEAEKGIVG